MSASHKRIIAGLLTIAVLTQATLLALPERANAQGIFVSLGRALGALFCPEPVIQTFPTGLYVPVYDSANAFVNTIDAKKNTGSFEKECILDFIGKTVGRLFIEAIANSIKQWILNGFEGGPTFVQDPINFYWNIADQTIGNMIDGAGLDWMCDPFRANIRLSLLLHKQNARSQPPRCSLSRIGGNFQNFISSDFADGGWESWLDMTTSRQNDPYGSASVAEEQLMLTISSAQYQESKRLDWGKGFHSILNDAGLTESPGAVVETQLEKMVGNDLDYLNISREIDDILATLVYVAIERVAGANGSLFAL